MSDTVVNADINFRLNAASIRPAINNLQAELRNAAVTIPVNFKIDQSQLSQLQSQIGSFKALSSTLNDLASSAGRASGGINKLGQGLASVSTGFTTIGNSAGNVKIATTSMSNLGNATSTTGASLNKATKESQSFAEAIGISAKRFSTFAVAAAAISTLVYQFSNATRAAIAFNDQMVKFKQVGGDTTRVIEDIQNTIGKLSTGLGVSSKDLSESSVTLRQAGLSANEVKVALETLAKTTVAPTFKNIQNTTEGMIAVLHQLNKGVGSLESQFGSINKVAADFAVESSDIVEFFRKAGSAAVAAGGDFNQAIAQFTAVRETTRESAETVATGLRTIYARLQDPTVISHLRAVGVELEHLGKFVGIFEAQKRLYDALKNEPTGSLKTAAVVKEVGGNRQTSRVIPFIAQQELTLKAYKSSVEGTDSLNKNVETGLESFQRKLAKLQETFLDLFRTIASNNSLQKFLDIIINLTTGLTQAIKTLEPLIPILAGGLILSSVSGSVGFTQRLVKGFKKQTFAEGGVIPDGNTGISGRDKIPILAEPGEFVITKQAARTIGYDKLHKVNASAGTERFAHKPKGMWNATTGGIIKFGFAEGGEIPTLDEIRRAAGRIKGPYGDKRALLHPTYEEVKKNYPNLTFSQFQKQVTSTPEARSLLGRFDLVGGKGGVGLDPDTLAKSSTPYLNTAEFHYIKGNPAAQPKTVKADRLALIKEMSEKVDEEGAIKRKAKILESRNNLTFAGKEVALQNKILARLSEKKVVEDTAARARVEALQSRQETQFRKPTVRPITQAVGVSGAIQNQAPPIPQPQPKPVFIPPPPQVEAKLGSIKNRLSSRKAQAVGSRGGTTSLGQETFTESTPSPRVHSALKAALPKTTGSIVLPPLAAKQIVSPVPIPTGNGGPTPPIIPPVIASSAQQPQPLRNVKTAQGYLPIFPQQQRGFTSPVISNIRSTSAQSVANVPNQPLKGQQTFDFVGFRNSTRNQQKQFVPVATIKGPESFQAQLPSPNQRLALPSPTSNGPARPISPAGTENLHALAHAVPFGQRVFAGRGVNSPGIVTGLAPSSRGLPAPKPTAIPLSEVPTQNRFNAPPLGIQGEHFQTTVGTFRNTATRPQSNPIQTGPSPFTSDSFADRRVEAGIPTIPIGIHRPGSNKDFPLNFTGGNPNGFQGQPFRRRNLQAGTRARLEKLALQSNPDQFANERDRFSGVRLGRGPNTFPRTFSEDEALDLARNTRRVGNNLGTGQGLNSQGFFNSAAGIRGQQRFIPRTKLPSRSTLRLDTIDREQFDSLALNGGSEQFGETGNRSLSPTQIKGLKRFGPPNQPFVHPLIKKTGIAAGLGLAYAAPSILESALGTAEKPGQFGSTGSRIGAGVGGLITGAATGGLIGAQIAGAPGAVIGTFVGGLTSATSALANFDKALETAEINDFTKRISNANINTKTGTFDTYDDKALFEKEINKLLPSKEALLDTYSTSSLPIGQKNFKGLLRSDKTFKGALEETIGEGKTQELSNKAFNTIKSIQEKNPEKSFFEIIDNLGAEFSKLGIDLDHLLKLDPERRASLIRETSSRNAAITLQNRLNSSIAKTTDEFEQVSKKFSIFGDNLEKAAENFDKGGDIVKNQASPLLHGKVTGIAGAPNISSLGPTGRELEEFGKTGGGYDQNKEIIRQVLDKIAFPDEQGELTEDQKGGQANQAEALYLEKLKKQKQQNYINSAGTPEDLAKFQGGLTGTEQAIRNQLKTEINLRGLRIGDVATQKGKEAYAEQILTPQKPLVEQRNKANAVLEKTFNEQKQRTAESLDINFGLSQKRVGLLENQSQFQKEDLGRLVQSNPLTSFGVDRSGRFRTPISAEEGANAFREGFVNVNQQKQLSEISGLGGNVTTKDLKEGIKAKQVELAGIDKKFKEAIKPGASEEQKKSVDALAADYAKTQDQIRRFSEALKHAAESTDKLEVAQNKFNIALSKRDNDLNARKNVAEIATFGSQQEKAQYAYREQLTRTAIQDPSKLNYATQEERDIVRQHLHDTEGIERRFINPDKYGRIKQDKFGNINEESIYKETGKQSFDRIIRQNLNATETRSTGQLQKDVLNARGDINVAQSEKQEANKALIGAQQTQNSKSDVLNLQLMQQFSQNFSKSVKEQADALSNFASSTSELVTALKSFPDVLTIKRDGVIQVILNGGEIIAKAKGDMEKEVIKQVIDQLKDKIKEEVNNQKAR